MAFKEANTLRHSTNNIVNWKKCMMFPGACSKLRPHRFFDFICSPSTSSTSHTKYTILSEYSFYECVKNVKGLCKTGNFLLSGTSNTSCSLRSCKCDVFNSKPAPFKVLYRRNYCWKRYGVFCRTLWVHGNLFERIKK